MIVNKVKCKQNFRNALFIKIDVEGEKKKKQETYLKVVKVPLNSTSLPNRNPDYR